jgi:hypothetical protein
METMLEATAQLEVRRTEKQRQVELAHTYLNY